MFRCFVSLDLRCQPRHNEASVQKREEHPNANVPTRSLRRERLLGQMRGALLTPPRTECRRHDAAKPLCADVTPVLLAALATS